MTAVDELLALAAEPDPISATESVESLIEGSMLICTIAWKVLGSRVSAVIDPTLMPLMRTSPPFLSPPALLNLAFT